jgi:two-component system chemotaxis sensor kinase CheA
MDVSEYLPMFLAEAREHLQGLNLAVVRVEEDPTDRETVDEIVRAAHSLKGMSATMGFSGVAALTHEMENVFELLRQRKGGLERAAIDVLLECLDALSAAVDAIDATGAAPIVMTEVFNTALAARGPQAHAVAVRSALGAILED